MATNSKKTKSPKGAAASPTEVDQQMQQVLILLSARTKGKATNEEVEKAVSKILSTAGLGPGPASTKQAAIKAPPAAPQAQVQVDAEDYDFVDEDSNDKKPAATTSPITTNVFVVPQANRKRKRSTEDKEAEEERKRQYEEIPLGQQGAHMMTAFGDGPCPIAEAVSAALLGARRLLQATIQDARALKRKNKQQFKKAKLEVAKHVKKSDVDASVEAAQKQTPEALPNPEMLYRAYIGYDRMARDTKCGFNYEQLKSLLPEEMRAYSRWNELKDEYQKNNDEKESAAAAEEKEDEPAEASEEKEKLLMDDQVKDGGHLLERAVQFDLRTNLMDEGWYMKFSEHRKGSFLPKRIKQEGDSEWEENRKTAAKRGRPPSNKEAGVWSQMSAKSARFLHWVGFDPEKGLPPPNDETTQALAFLGYDFFGRIVEKAIFLKNLAKEKESTDEVDERTIMLELEEGEQLQKDDIDQAIDAIRPAAMYSATSGLPSTQKPVAQLYFGPGFEERVEMELDEMMCRGDGAKRGDLSEEEAKIRKQEDNLFAKMAELPTTNNAVMHLLGKEENGSEGAETKPKRTKRSPKKSSGGLPFKKDEFKKWGDELAG